MLPEPSPGDLFFDIEGDPFFGSEEVDGIDYLFGVIEPGRADADGQLGFHAIWSIEDGTVTTGAERRAFEAFIDLVVDRLKSDPKLHIYHYAPIRADCREAPRRALRHPRRGGRRTAARRCVRRPLPGRAPGHPGVCRELLDQAVRAAL